MKKRSLLSIIVLLVMLTVTACTSIAEKIAGIILANDDSEITESPDIPESSPEPMATPVQDPTIMPTDIPEPIEEHEPVMASIQMASDFWFTYNTLKWKGVDESEYQIPHLISLNDPGCVIYVNNGHGMPNLFEVTTKQVTIGETQFSLTDWVYKGTSDIGLRSYLWADAHIISVEGNNFPPLSQQCLQDVEDVLTSSEALDFKPLPGFEALTKTVPPIVYVKSYNIWAYYTETGERKQVTLDGGEKHGNITTSYDGPKVSPDGRFVAFQEYNSRFVYVYSFETAELWTSEPYMQEDDVRDRVLGWGSNNQLYISRHFGNCDFFQNEPVKRHVVEIYIFDFIQGQLNYAAILPNEDTHDYAYPQAVDMSKNGRYINYVPSGCSRGGPFYHLVYDTHTGKTLEMSSWWSMQVSNGEDRIAYADGTWFESSTTIWIAEQELPDGLPYLLNTLADSELVWTYPYWSFDDKYIVMSKYYFIEAVESIIGLTPSDLSFVIGNASLEMVESGDYSAISKPLTADNPKDENWIFGAWSPVDYRIVVVRTPSYDAGASHYQPYELWLMNPITGEHYIIDEADYIFEPDW